MAWISFGALPCRKKKTWWKLASWCCWNRARPWRASELVSFLVGLRTYQHTGAISLIYILLISAEHSGAVSPANTCTVSYHLPLLAVLKPSNWGVWWSCEEGEAGIELGTVRSWQLAALPTVWGSWPIWQACQLTDPDWSALPPSRMLPQTPPCHIALLRFRTVQSSKKTIFCCIWL